MARTRSGRKLGVFAGVLAIVAGYGCEAPQTIDIGHASRDQLALACSMLKLDSAYGQTAEVATGVHAEILPAKGSNSFLVKKKLKDHPKAIARIELKDSGSYSPFGLTHSVRTACWYLSADDSGHVFSISLSLAGNTLRDNIPTDIRSDNHIFNPEAHWVPKASTGTGRSGFDPRPTDLHAEEHPSWAVSQGDTTQGMIMAAQGSCGKTSCCYPR